jgi:3-hydroxy-9,10-secoandrosta-1,3,5(10)-triene-9,17-dione monooxygenase reductase component
MADVPADSDPGAQEPARQPAAEADGPNPAEYRRVLGHFPTGVTIVTATGPGGPVGLAVNSFTSVSLRQPLVGFFPAHTSGSWPVIRQAGAFCVNVLGAQQEDLARIFASPGTDRFRGLSVTPAPCTGAPVLAGAVAWIDCTIEAVTPAGDHDFALGRVRAVGTDPAQSPLLFHRGGYHSFS